MDGANFSGRHDNMQETSELQEDSVTELKKKYLISAIREWSRILVGKDKTSKAIWLTAHVPKWWLKSYPPWRNPTGKKKDDVKELKMKYAILENRLRSNGTFPEQWVKQAELYRSKRFKDLFFLTSLKRIFEKLQEVDEELNDTLSESSNHSNFSTTSVVGSIEQSAATIQIKIKKLRNNLSRNSSLINVRCNLSAEKQQHYSSSVLNIVPSSKTLDINTTHLQMSTDILPTYCTQNKNTQEQNSPRTTTKLQQHYYQHTPPTPSTHSKPSPKRAATKYHAEISPKIPKFHFQTTLEPKNPENPENNFIANPVGVVKADFLSEVPGNDENQTSDDSTITISGKHFAPSPDEGFSSVGFISESDSSPVKNPPNKDHRDTPEQTDLYLEDGTFNLYQFLFS